MAYLTHTIEKQDGDATSLESRWSCKPDLGTGDATCSISYTLAESLDIVGLNVGKER